MGTPMSHAKTAEPIEMPFGGQARVVIRNHVLARGAYWRHMANMTERFQRGGDAALNQIILTTRC